MATFRKRRGKWQVQIRRQGQPPLSRTFVLQADASAWARLIEAKQDRGDGVVDTRPLRSTTIDALLERYLTTVTVRKRGADIEAIRIKCLRRTELARLSLAAATPDRFAAYRDRRLAEVSSATVRKEMALLRHLFRIARQEWNLPLAVNPLADLQAPAPAKARTRRLSPEESERLTVALKGLRSRTMRALIQFALETGMRRSELAKCRWTHIDCSARTLLIPNTKTDIARTIPLSSAALATLDALGRNADGLIFPVTTNAIKLAWQRVRNWARMPDFRFHDLRHEAISRFFEHGLSVPEVALISGHRDVRMLMRYTHLKAETVAAKLS